LLGPTFLFFCASFPMKDVIVFLPPPPHSKLHVIVLWLLWCYLAKRTIETINWNRRLVSVQLRSVSLNNFVSYLLSFSNINPFSSAFCSSLTERGTHTRSHIVAKLRVVMLWCHVFNVWIRICQLFPWEWSHVGSELLTAMVMKSSIIWYITPCNSFEIQPTFRRNISPPSSESKEWAKQETSVKQVTSRACSEDGDMFLRNVCWISTRCYIPEDRVLRWTDMLNQTCRVSSSISGSLRLGFLVYEVRLVQVLLQVPSCFSILAIVLARQRIVTSAVFKLLVSYVTPHLADCRESLMGYTRDA
jgi:hypothetical protein